jgi:DNA-binding response OmpR family regulator
VSTACLANPLQGKRILVVEDELLLAMELEKHLVAAGAIVAGPAARLAKALQLLERERPDAAVLDLNLHGEWPVALAEALTRKQVPFIVVTGYSNCDVAPFRGVCQLNKPIDARELANALCQAMGLSTA